jgi:hypothetical protein
LRKLLASALSVGVLASPVALASAADDDQTEVESITANQSQRTKPVELAQATVDRAAERVKQKQEQIRQRRLERQEAAEAAAVPAETVASPELEAIAACESGGDPTAVSADGTYRGKYQFSYETWASVGGSGDPAAAPESEQDMRAQMLLDQSGTSPWPVCG